jgi:hypothetical protein
LGGGGGAALGSAVASALQNFSKQVQKSMAPVTVDPSKWANAPPSPVYFTPPTLARNIGAAAPWA